MVNIRSVFARIGDLGQGFDILILCLHYADLSYLGVASTYSVGDRVVCRAFQPSFVFFQE